MSELPGARPSPALQHPMEPGAKEEQISREKAQNAQKYWNRILQCTV